MVHPSTQQAANGCLAAPQLRSGWPAALLAAAGGAGCRVDPPELLHNVFEGGAVCRFSRPAALQQGDVIFQALQARMHTAGELARTPPVLLPLPLHVRCVKRALIRPPPGKPGPGSERRWLPSGPTNPVGRLPGRRGCRRQAAPPLVKFQAVAPGPPALQAVQEDVHGARSSVLGQRLAYALGACPPLQPGCYGLGTRAPAEPSPTCQLLRLRMSAKGICQVSSSHSTTPKLNTSAVTVCVCVWVCVCGCVGGVCVARRLE